MADSKVFEKMRAHEDKVISDFKATLEDNLRSIERYYNPYPTLLLIVRTLDFKTIMALKPIVERYQQKGTPLPVLFTQEELTRGVDVFPVEFLTMQQTAEHLLGEKILSRIQFNREHVRRQLEFELRSKLIHLRENILNAPKETHLKELLMVILPEMLPLCRGMLYLRGKRASSPEDIIKECATSFAADMRILGELIELAKNPRSLTAQETQAYLNRTMALLESIIPIIDKLAKR